MAQKLSRQLRAAEGRIAELEAEVDLYRERTTAQSNGSIRSTRRLGSGSSGWADISALAAG
jgi:hypothetical protein